MPRRNLMIVATGLVGLGAAAPTVASASAPPAGTVASAPAVDCAEIAADLDDSSQVDVFMSAIETLPDSVSDEIVEPFTFFVPANVAFDEMPSNVLDALLADPALVTELLYFHTVPGAELTVADLAAAGEATALSGDDLTFAGEGDAVSINGGEATIICPDIAGDDDDDDDGLIVHVIDGVLRPPSMGGATGSSVPGPGSSTPSSSAAAVSFDEEQQAVATVWETVVDSSSTFDDVAALIDDSDELRATIEAYPAAADVVGGIGARVTSVDIVGDTADITYVVAFGGVDAPYGELAATLELEDGQWVVPEDEYCAVMAYARNDCPAD